MKNIILAILIISVVGHANSQSRYSDYGENQKNTIFLDNFSSNVNKWWTGDEGGDFIFIRK